MGTEGDSFFVVFERARDAAAAAMEAQRRLATHEWPHGERVRVRMGLHTGEPVAHGEGYVGIDVHRAARVAGVAHGGQVVLTDTTSRLIAGALPDGARLDDLGQHRLKDLALAEHLYQLTVVGLDSDFPPVRSLGTSFALPPQLTPLVGREAELARIVELLATPACRLVTLTGPGGSGKTRLAVAAAAEVGDAFVDGVHFVSLSGATRAEAMWNSLAEMLLPPGVVRSRDHLLVHVAHHQMMLVLDNLEQITGADGVVADLLASAPGVTVLATSRRPLHLRGERDLAIPPLALEPYDPAETSAAVHMFCLHAQLVRSTFQLDKKSAGAVAAICQRLDGLPLAIELAAARSRLLSPEALLARLDASWGSPSTADRPERHRTVRDTIAWSYNLLSPELQGVFCRLGAFAGPADLDAVAAVSSLDLDPLDAVAELADVSLVQVIDGSDNEPRVDLLQTVRTFAKERLADSGEHEDTQERHARYFLQQAEKWAPLLHSPRQLVASERLSAVGDDFEAALAWTLQPGNEAPPGEEAELGLRMVAALWWHWTANGQREKRRRWCERAIDVAPEGDSPAKAATLHALELQNSWVDDPDMGLPLRRTEEALAIYDRLGDRGGMSEVASTLAQLHVRRGDAERARQLYEHAVAWAQEGGDDARRLSAMYYYSELLEDEGQVEMATAMIEEGRDLARIAGDEREALRFDMSLAGVLIEQGDIDAAQALLHEMVPDVMRQREPMLTTMFVGTCVWLLGRVGDAERVCRLQAAYEALGAGVGWEAYWTLPEGTNQQRQSALREGLGADAWNRGHDEGGSWSAQEALTYIAKALAKPD
jgi:predicted ATPase